MRDLETVADREASVCGVASRPKGGVRSGQASGLRPLGGLLNDWGWDERELVRRCREGSEAAYAELVRQHRPRLYTLAYRLTNDSHTAEDVVQESFIAAFRQIERFEPKPSLAAWLNTIAVRIAGRKASKQRARPHTSLDLAIASDGGSDLSLLAADATGSPHEAAEAAELRRELAQAIAALPFKYRAAVVLRYDVGLDYAEAARELDVPLNTYKSHLLRGMRMLRDQLGAQLAAPATGRAPAVRPSKIAQAIDPVAAQSTRNGPSRSEPIVAREKSVGS